MVSDTKATDTLNMSALGDKLRQVREGKNLTIGQAQRQTRIHSTVLKALEDGKCDSMLNPAYVKSFLKQYCNYLGMDSRQVLIEYKKLHPETESAPIYKLQEAAKAHSNGLSNMVPFIKLVTVGAVVIALVVFAGVKVVSYFKKPALSKRATALKAKQKAVQPKISRKAPARKASTLKAVAPALKSAAPKKDMEASIPKNVQLKLLLKVNQNVLIKMRTDGVLLFERVLTKGTAEMFTADDVINIFAANGEYIELILNGKVIGSPGKGVLKNIEITRSGIKLR